MKFHPLDNTVAAAAHIAQEMGAFDPPRADLLAPGIVLEKLGAMTFDQRQQAIEHGRELLGWAQ